MARRIAIVGTGVIGAGWATCFLARGLDVHASDPAPEAEDRLRELVARQWPAAEALGLAPGASQDRLRFSVNPGDAAASADFVQESAPERLELKRALFALLDEAAPPDVLLASSTSGIAATAIQAACRNPQRVVIGHPFHPAYLIPLVEVVGGEQTSADAIERALAFYKSVGKQPIHVRTEKLGFVTNRLQAALWREAYGLVAAGVASVEDIDTAISNGPGLRWALLGPFITQSLSGGPGGMAHLLDHLGPAMDDYWQDLIPTRMTAEVKRAVVEGTVAALGGRDPVEIASQRDALLVALLRLKAGRGGEP